MISSLRLRYETKTVLSVICAASQEELARMVAEEIKRALSAGATVEHRDGSREWISSREVHDESGRLVWHTDGNRCRWRRCHVKVSADGDRTETELRSTWRKPEGL